MNPEIKQFLETLHFHGYIDHDITKLDKLIEDYYPNKTESIPSDEEIHAENLKYYNNDFGGINGLREYRAFKKGAEWMRFKMLKNT